MELWCIKKIVVIVGLLVTSCYGARPLNILFVTGHFPSRSQTFIKNEIKGMIDRGHNVGIFSISDSDGTEFTKEDKEVYQLHIRTFYRKFPYHFLPCDVVVCEFGYNASRIIDSEITRGWLRGKKLTATFRGSDLSAHYKKNPHRYDQLFERCDFFFTVCESFKNRLIEIGCNPDKIVVHHSAIDCLLFSSKNKHVVQKKDAKVYFLSVSRLVEKKGIEYVIRAVAYLAPRYPNIQYTIVGDGPDAQKLRVLVQELGVINQVTFFGWATQEQVTHLLNKSDIFILPSICGEDGNEEGIPNSLKEAMAMRKPVISTIHSGIPELIEDGISGFLVAERDFQALAEKMEWLMNHQNTWISMGRAGRKKIKREYEVKKNAKRFEKLLYEIIGIRN